MSFLGLLGILLGLVFYPLAVKDATRQRVAVFFVAYVTHVAAGYVYYLYVLSAGGDSDIYYFDELRIYEQEFGAGTIFVVYVVQTLKGLIGGTYLDYFFLFQAVGFGGIAMIMRIIEEVHEGMGAQQDAIPYLLLFLPGLHFWTAAIGKDALLFFGTMLAMWSVIQFRRRQIAFACGVLLVGFVRPHIAIACMVALAVSMFFARETSRPVRFLLAIVALGAAGAMVGTIQSTYNIDVYNAESVSDFFARQEFLTESASGGNTVVTGNFAFRLISLLFRPFFIDAQNIFAVVTSFENVVMAIVVFRMVHGWRTLVALFRSNAFVRYVVTYSFGVALLLTVVYYNVGLGLRQRTMFVPGFLILFVIIRLVQRARSDAVAAEEAAPYHPNVAAR